MHLGASLWPRQHRRSPAECRPSGLCYRSRRLGLSGFHKRSRFPAGAAASLPSRGHSHQSALYAGRSIRRSRAHALSARDHAPAFGLPGIQAAHTHSRKLWTRTRPCLPQTPSDDAPAWLARAARQFINCFRVVRLGSRASRQDRTGPHMIFIGEENRGMTTDPNTRRLEPPPDLQDWSENTAPIPRSPQTFHDSHLMSLSGVKRTCHFALHMSAFDPKRTWSSPLLK